MAKSKYYVVWIGKTPGVYASWAECQQQTDNVPAAKYKSFASRSEADGAFSDGWQKHWGQGKSTKPAKKNTTVIPTTEEIDYASISVDVGTRGNPGPVEYKGVDTQTGEVIFSHGPISKGTNNLGEFLAIVHGLAYLDKQGSDKTVYSDSLNAIKWVKDKAVSSTLIRDDSTEEIWNLVDRAVHWLQTHPYKNKVKKWHTQSWGEIKADYGRK